MTTFDCLLRIADQLVRTEHGNPEVDRAVHDAQGQAGPVLAYTRNEAAARLLLPAKFEWMEHTYSGSKIYAACRRSGRDADGIRYPHHGQWGHTLALAMCGAIMQARAALAKG